MDLSFFRRAQTKFGSRSAARLDYGVLVATLDAVQAASSAARALRGFGAEAGAAMSRDPLVELILGGPGWRDAIAAQGGSFNPAQAQRSGRGV